MVSTNASMALGFSLSGATIPAGEGTLISLTFTATDSELCFDAVAVKVRLINVPSPAGIVAPDNENPRAIDAFVETIKPASAELPPEAPNLSAPLNEIWNPPTGSVFYIYTSAVPAAKSTFSSVKSITSRLLKLFNSQFKETWEGPPSEVSTISGPGGVNELSNVVPSGIVQYAVAEGLDKIAS
jgi:hypothetical protein